MKYHAAGPAEVDQRAAMVRDALTSGKLEYLIEATGPENQPVAVLLVSPNLAPEACAAFLMEILTGMGSRG